MIAEQEMKLRLAALEAACKISLPTTSAETLAKDAEVIYKWLTGKA